MQNVEAATPYRAALARVENPALVDVKAIVVAAVVDCEKAQAEIAAIDVTEDAGAAAVTEWLGITKAAAKRLGEQRDALMRPLNDRRKIVLDFFNDVEAAVKATTSAAEVKIVAWTKHKDLQRKKDADHDEAIRMEAQRELDRIEREKAERERIAKEEAAKAEAAGKAVEVTAVVVNPEEERRHAQAMAALTAPRPAAPGPIARGVRTDYGTSSVGEDFDYTVTDAWAIPRHFVKAPEPRRSSILQEIRELHKAGKLADDAALSTAIAGVTITRKDKVNFR